MKRRDFFGAVAAGWAAPRSGSQGVIKDRDPCAGQDLLERRVRISESLTIAPPTGGGGQYLVRLPDESVITTVRDGDGAYALRSHDRGRSWARIPQIPPYPSVLGDGTIVAVGYMPIEPGQEGEFRYPLWRGKSIDDLQPVHCKINVPRAVSGTGDDHRINAIPGMLFYSPVITELADGRLLATMYGWFSEDTQPKTEPSYEAAMKRGVPHYQYRSIVIQSPDRGLSWHYVSTIAAAPLGTEGPCEPSMVQTQEGDLVAVMRVGRTTPLYLARSTDLGRSWSPPEPLHSFGVAPYMIRMSDGTLACAYGVKEDYWKGRQRRDARIMFSFDSGRRWTVDKLVYGGEAGSYPAICEIEPGTLLFSYDPSAWNAPGPLGKRCVRVARIRVEAL